MTRPSGLEPQHVSFSTSARQGSALDGLAGADDVAAAWKALSLDRRRAVIDLLAEVTVLPRASTCRL